MAKFESDLLALSNIDWSGNYIDAIEIPMQDMVFKPRDFAEFISDAFREGQSDIIEQIKGVLFFVVNWYPEIFILIDMYLKDEGDVRLKSILEVYSLFIIES